MPSIGIAQFRAEVLDLYAPPLRSRATWFKARQVLDLLALVPGVRGTSDLTAPAVARFIRVAGEGRNPNTINGLLDYLRAFCGYAVSAGYLRRSPFAGRSLRLRPVEADRPRHLGREAIGRVLALLESEATTWPGRRLFALGSLVALTGLRKSEALLLHQGDVSLATGLLAIVARHRLKTVASAQPVPIPGPLAEVLGGWLPHAGPTWLFPNLSRTGPWTGGPPGGKPLDQLRAAGLRAGVANFGFLTLRHSWATHAEAWGLGEAMIQRILRHTTPLTQRCYRHADAENLRASVRHVRYDAPAAGAGG